MRLLDAESGFVVAARIAVLPLACGGEVRRSADQGTSTTQATSDAAVGGGWSGRHWWRWHNGCAGGAAGATGFSCSEACELELGGVPAGIYWCQEGYDVRQKQVTCPNHLPPKGEGGAPSAFEQCTSHADCSRLDFCQYYGNPLGTFCRDGCQTDADCDLSHPAAMFLTSERGRAWPLLALGFLALFGACTKERADAQQGPGSTVPTVQGAPAPATGPFGCHLLLPKARRAPKGLETIRLQPPDPAEKSIVLNKTGVIATFSRDEFLTTARCLGLKQAVANLEAETGHAQESPLRDAFGLSYVAAALLDVGRVGVRLRSEPESRRTIVRDAWSREGCGGKCRSFGRVYQLTDADPVPFFSVSDRVEPHPE